MELRNFRALLSIMVSALFVAVPPLSSPGEAFGAADSVGAAAAPPAFRLLVGVAAGVPVLSLGDVAGEEAAAAPLRLPLAGVAAGEPSVAGVVAPGSALVVAGLPSGAGDAPVLALRLFGVVAGAADVGDVVPVVVGEISGDAPAAARAFFPLRAGAGDGETVGEAPVSAAAAGDAAAVVLRLPARAAVGDGLAATPAAAAAGAGLTPAVGVSVAPGVDVSPTAVVPPGMPAAAVGAGDAPAAAVVTAAFSNFGVGGSAAGSFASVLIFVRICCTSACGTPCQPRSTRTVCIVRVTLGGATAAVATRITGATTCRRSPCTCEAKRCVRRVAGSYATSVRRSMTSRGIGSSLSRVMTSYSGPPT